MSYTLLSESFPVARKKHRCIWCGQSIPAGEKYRREASVFDDGFQNHAWHPECYEDCQIQNAGEGEYEIDPYGNDRPPRATETVAQK